MPALPYEAIYELTSDAVYELELHDDRSPVFVRVNPAAARQLGRASREVVGLSLAEVLGEQAGDTERRARECARTRAMVKATRAVRLPTGDAIFETTLVPRVDDEGRVFGVLGVARDVTDRADAERALREANAELERRVEERTAELRATVTALESFCYSVSHDLRTPLRAIDGFSRALLEDHRSALDAKGQDYLDRVCRAARRMDAIIDALLALSRLDRAELELARVDVTALGREVWTDLDHGPRTTFDASPGLVAEADPRLLRVVLENLLGNALKFTRDASTPRVELGGDSARRHFWVRDNGVGFDPRHAARLFQPFQRVHADRFPGEGIGLATVLRAVTRHGGRAWAEGAVDAGATFHFTLGSAA
ncbi:MAG: PAS domain-containing protein [Myxococcales bacterium]|nr:PAS domain-containing protein [Myxococcales bacterium]